MSAIDPDLLCAFREAVRAKIRHDLDREEALSRTLRERTLPPLREAIARARTQGLCARVWLFGSFAWGEPSERSDLDLLVEECPDPDRLGALVARACDRDVHAVELEGAADSLRQRVLGEGLAL